LAEALSLTNKRKIKLKTLEKSSLKPTTLLLMMMTMMKMAKWGKLPSNEKKSERNKKNSMHCTYLRKILKPGRLQWKLVVKLAEMHLSRVSHTKKLLELLKKQCSMFSDNTDQLLSLWKEG
jgi:hypothetical protein